MKRRCVPLRADHDLLTPDTHTLSGVRLHPAIQVKSGGVASSSGHQSDWSGSESSRRRLTTSPARRLRFEDETEREVESRYLERQKLGRWGGQRGTVVLVSKPHLDVYIKGAGLFAERGRTLTRESGQCGSCKKGLGSTVNLNLPLPEDRPHLNLMTEPIRETYIGSVTPGEVSGGEGGAGRVSNKQLRRRFNQGESAGNQMTTPTIDLPINPYAPDQLTTPMSSCLRALAAPPVMMSSMMSQSVQLNDTKSEQNLNQEERMTPAAQTHREVRSGADCVEEAALGLRTKTSCSSSCSSCSSSRSSSCSSGRTKMTADSQAPPTSGSSDGQVRQPMRAEDHDDDTSRREGFISRDEPSRLSLRRLFSNVRLSRTRTVSVDRLSCHPPASEPDNGPLGSRKSSGLLRKTPSVQSLHVQGAPFLPLRKSSSVQSLVSEQKNRSADYRPAADQLPRRCLSIEDIGRPSSVRSVGKILQVCSDGAVLLEVNRPKNQQYGFMISRGRGRPDSGVYVEDMVDSSTEKMFSGLLAVGDEILEVNGEKVVCLSLDQVTHLLTQNTSATVRVLRHRPTPLR